MNNKFYFIIVFLSFFYPQWAMWANPSLPVGNSDRGVGLGAGEVMVFADLNYQNFIWWHDIVPGAIIPGTTNIEEASYHSDMSFVPGVIDENIHEEHLHAYDLDHFKEFANF